MPRSSNAARTALEASGEGGIGAPSGITRAISERSRSPRSVRKSCTRRAVSLGAGGHLNGVDVTPMTTRPPSNASRTSRQANAPATV